MRPKPISANIYFNLSFWGGVIAALIISTFIISTNDLYWCSQIACFSRFLIIFDFPIKILSASLAISAFVALIHRSEQTRHQIEISINQNIFKNYIDHKKDFMEMIALMESDFPIKITDKNALYKKLFPNNNTQNLEFTSAGKNGDRSDLSFFIENHNKLILQYNEIMRNCNTGLLCANKCFAMWLSEYLMLSLSLEIRGDELIDIDPEWDGFIPHRVFKGLPSDIEGFLYACERVLAELFRFCFPNEPDRTLIESRINSSVVQNLMSVYCVKDGKKHNNSIKIEEDNN